MAFSIETIREMCKAEKEIYNIAEQLEALDCVKIESVQNFWRGEVTVESQVKENDNSYQTKFTLKEGQYFSYLCSCKGGSRKKFCGHLAAASLAYYRILEKKALASIVTSPAMHKILQEYERQNIIKVMEEQKQGNVILEPILHYSEDEKKTENKVSLSFRVRYEKRIYGIKNLIDFYREMKYPDMPQYQETIKFLYPHNPWAFTQENKSVVDFTLQLIEEQIEYSKQFQINIEKNSENAGRAELTKANVDKFFALFYDKSIFMEDDTSFIKNIMVKKENPFLHLRLEEIGAGNFRVALKEKIQTIIGKQFIYILLGETVYCCGREYSNYMKVFLREAGKKQNKNMEYHINRKDMPIFYTQFFENVKNYTDIEGEAYKLKEFIPYPVKGAFSFDITMQGEITCKEELRYGDFLFNPVTEKNIPESIHRDYPREIQIKNIVEKYFKDYSSSDGVWIAYEEKEKFSLFDGGVEEFLRVGEVFLSEEFKRVKPKNFSKISIGVSFYENLLELKVDAKNLTEKDFIELLNNYKLRKKYFKLETGEFIKIENTGLSILPELMEGLSLSAKELKKGTIELPVYRAVYLENVLGENPEIEFQRDKVFMKFTQALNHIEKNDYIVPNSLKQILRGYQKTGYDWLKTLKECRMGGILADEMGLGKTLQIITFLLSEKESLEKPAIIISPASLIYNWENEIRRFAPELEIKIIAGTSAEREALLKMKDTAAIWLTSYDLLKRDIELYLKENLKFSYQVLDEAQVIKNHSTQSAKAVKALPSELRFALTGTPIENRLSELWSIFDYLMPGFLYSYRKFKTEFETPIIKNKDETAVRKLRNMMKPFVLRRLKKDVLKDLPDKLESVVYCRLGEEQQNLYTAAAWKLKAELEGKAPEEISENKIKILAELTRLRQICCAPEICYQNYGGDSAKFLTCMELVRDGMEGGHKILLFSQFTSMLEIMEKQLKKEKIPYYVLTGATKKQERVLLAEQFNQEKRACVFLISLKAGGTGLNLTGADIVIHYDPWWNVAAQNQAADRAHRIGQKNTVTVLKLVAKDTIEENILKLQESKQALADQIIGGTDSGFAALTKEDLLNLLY